MPLLIVFSLCPASISSVPGVQRQKMMSMLNQNCTCRKKHWRKLSFSCLSRCMTLVQVQGGGQPPVPTTLHPSSPSWPPDCLFPFIYLQPTHDPSARLMQVLCLYHPLQHWGSSPLWLMIWARKALREGWIRGSQVSHQGCALPPSLCQMHTQKCVAFPALEKGVGFHPLLSQSCLLTHWDNQGGGRMRMHAHLSKHSTTHITTRVSLWSVENGRASQGWALPWVPSTDLPLTVTPRDHPPNYPVQQGPH